MRALIPALCRVILILITLLVMPAGIMAQDAGDSDQAYRFSKEELTQMLAPIALYPDAMTAQILMASTYPLEVVEADRWRSQNRELKGDDLDSALQNKSWDPSIKSICHFPDLLTSMSDKLDQTRKLGDAFLGQEEEVMATIQELRGKAMAQGTLKTTAEQKVIVENDAVSIEPVNPEVIYVPVYDPAYVYGPWWYPAYPPYYWYYPPGFYGGFTIGFGPGIFFGFDAFSWVRFDWRFHRIHTDISRTRHFNRHFDRRGDGQFWRHNPAHRSGVAYRDLRTSERFGSRAPRVSSPAGPSGPERRGYPGGRIDRQNVRPSQAPAQRVERQNSPQAPQLRQAPAVGTQAPAVRPVVRDTPFRGVGQGNFERRAAERGGISNQGTVVRPQSGGSSGAQMPQRQTGGGVQGGGGSRGGGAQGGGSRGGGQSGGSRGDHGGGSRR
ncbi:MAG: DUF3300 domain-containing protein [Desulfuromonadales bacterium]|nr:DUF3300 domain-containing protein [Desulfuromonadales bacterium]